MTEPKLYALRTIPPPGENGEWVGNAFGNIYTTREPENSDLRKIDAEIWVAGHPCEWVEVVVLEAKPVNPSIIDDLNEYGPITPESDISIIAWAQGFRAACEYLGVKVEEEKQ